MRMKWVFIYLGLMRALSSPVTECCTMSDLDCSGVVGTNDLLILLEAYGIDDAGDIDGNGVTDVQDLIDLFSDWARTCES